MTDANSLGALEVVNKDQTDYTEEDVTIQETLAAPETLGIHNTNLLRRTGAGFPGLFPS